MVGLEEDVVRLPRAALPLPVELRPPPGFQVDHVESWPRVDGRLEFVSGRLLYMPPRGDVQQDVAAAAVAALYAWSRGTTGFVVAGNEASMILGGDARGADVAIWRREDAEPRTGGFRRKPPLLAVEIAGRDEDEAALREKAAWYLAQGVRCVWLVLPDTREVALLGAAGEKRLGVSDTLAVAELPGLSLPVAELFAQL